MRFSTQYALVTVAVCIGTAQAGMAHALPMDLMEARAVEAREAEARFGHGGFFHKGLEAAESLFHHQSNPNPNPNPNGNPNGNGNQQRSAEAEAPVGAIIERAEGVANAPRGAEDPWHKFQNRNIGLESRRKGHHTEQVQRLSDFTQAAGGLYQGVQGLTQPSQPL